MLEALLSADHHEKILSVWKVVDEGFKVRFTYLVHIYKIKLVRITQESICINFLNTYNDSVHFQNGKSTFFEGVFRVINSLVERLVKIKRIQIFKAVCFEVFSKCFFYVALHFGEMTKHPKFDLSRERLVLLITELESLPNKVIQILEDLDQNFKIEVSESVQVMRIKVLNNMFSRINENMIDLFANDTDRLVEDLFSSNSSNVSYANVAKIVKQELDKTSTFPESMRRKLEQMQVRSVVGRWLQNVLQNSKEYLRTNIPQMVRNVGLVLKEFKDIPIEAEEKFLECLCQFLSDSNQRECQKAFSLMVTLLDPPLHRKELMQVIAAKAFDGKDFSDQLRNSLTDFLNTNKAIKERLAIRKKWVMKIKVTMIISIFLVRINGKNRRVGNPANFEKIRKTILELTKEKTEKENPIKKVKVTFLVFSKTQMRLASQTPKHLL